MLSPQSTIFAWMQYTLKKSLGQHFLKDEHICKKILATLEDQLDRTGIQQLVEVGAGGGALTKYLLQINDIDFKAVELDDEKVSYLQKTFPVLKDKVIHNDFLEIHPPFENDFIV